MAGFSFARKADIDATIAMVRGKNRTVIRSKNTTSGRAVTASQAATLGCIFKTPVGGIDGRVGVAVSFAECDAYYIDDDDELVMLLDASGETITMEVYHIGTSEISGGTYIQAKYCFNKLIADMEDCG